jgi:hypothetical protein
VRGPTSPTPARPWVGTPGQWPSPPIPAGYYNPILDIQLSEGKQGSEQQITGLERQKTNAETNYATNLGLLKQREEARAQQQKETLANLAESYAKLGVRQGDQANAAGTLYGGALISAAAKRAANEGATSARDREAYRQAVLGFQDEQGKLARAEQEQTGTLAEAIANARLNQQLFGQNINTLKQNQAAGQGYVVPITVAGGGPPGSVVNTGRGSPAHPIKAGFGMAEQMERAGRRRGRR